MKYEYNRQKYIRVQRLLNLRIAKVFRTMSREALCVLAGLTPIIINTEEAVKLDNLNKKKGSQKQIIDREVELKNGLTRQTRLKLLKERRPGTHNPFIHRR
jgi:hypothetical protein